MIAHNYYTRRTLIKKNMGSPTVLMPLIATEMLSELNLYLAGRRRQTDTKSDDTAPVAI